MDEKGEVVTVKRQRRVLGLIIGRTATKVCPLFDACLTDRVCISNGGAVDGWMMRKKP